MDLGVKLEKPTSDQRTEHDFRNYIGSLMYIAVGFRPDIAHAFSYLSQSNECYDKTHWKSAKRVIRYHKGIS